MTSWLMDALNGSGRTAVFPGMSPIEPSSGPRKILLKTRIVKKELGPTWKRNVSSFDSFVAESIPFS
jgi:hypothetical protein